MNIVQINRLVAVLAILTNIGLLPLFYNIVMYGGYAIILLPIFLVALLFLIPIRFTFKDAYKRSVPLMVINGIGLAWNIFWLIRIARV